MAFSEMVHSIHCRPSPIHRFVSLYQKKKLLPNQSWTPSPEIFLYGFLVPMLPYMLEERMHQDPSQTQRLTSISLALHGLVSAFGGPLIGHLADKAPNRKVPFLVALVGCIIGTFMVACTTDVGIFFGGRVLQGISGSGAWIVGLATAADTVGPGRIGTTMGIIMAFVNAAMVTGPMVSGLILEMAGYWLTWSVPVVILVVDVVARLLMVEKEEISDSKTSADAQETDPLLEASDQEEVCEDANTPTANFWQTMLSNRRVMTALLIGVWGPTLNTSFNATLPLHVSDIFGWGPSRVGMMFFLLALPGLPISPLAGYLRDRIGTRTPATIALALQGAFLILLGFAGNKQFEWSSAAGRGKALYIFCCIIFGTLRPFVSGIGPVELTCQSSLIPFWNRPPGSIRDPVLTGHLQVLSKPKKQSIQESLDREAASRVSFPWSRSPPQAG